MKSTRKVRPSWLSSLGFLVLLALFVVLPFGAVSCSTNGPSGAGTADVHATGAQLGLGKATITATGVFDHQQAPEIDRFINSAFNDSNGLHWLGNVTLLLAIAGLVVPWTVRLAERLQQAIATGVAVVGAVLTTALGLTLLSEWTSGVQTFAALLSSLPEGQATDLSAHAGDLVSLDVGFWVELAGFAALAAANAVLLVRGRSRAPDADRPPPPAPG